MYRGFMYREKSSCTDKARKAARTGGIRAVLPRGAPGSHRSDASRSDGGSASWWLPSWVPVSSPMPVDGQVAGPAQASAPFVCAAGCQSAAGSYPEGTLRYGVFHANLACECDNFAIEVRPAQHAIDDASSRRPVVRKHHTTRFAVGCVCARSWDVAFFGSWLTWS